jgi:hypothetical protein
MNIIIELADTAELEQLASEAASSTRPARQQLGFALQAAIARIVREQVTPLASAPTSTMTIEQFRASRQWCDDLGAKLKDASFEQDGKKARGWIYLDALFIERVENDWPEATRRRGDWHLILGNAEYISFDIFELERRLFDWAVSEGYDVEHAA